MFLRGGFFRESPKIFLPHEISENIWYPPQKKYLRSISYPSPPLPPPLPHKILISEKYFQPPPFKPKSVIFQYRQLSKFQKKIGSLLSTDTTREIFQHNTYRVLSPWQTEGSKSLDSRPPCNRRFWQSSYRIPVSWLKKNFNFGNLDCSQIKDFSKSFREYHNNSYSRVPNCRGGRFPIFGFFESFLKIKIDIK